MFLLPVNIITPKLANESTFGRVNTMRSCDLTMNTMQLQYIVNENYLLTKRKLPI